MKNFFIIALLVVFSANLGAQTYKPVLNKNNSWNILWAVCDAAHTDSLFSVKDSIKGNTIFASVYKSQLSNKIGYLAEDTLAGKMTFHDYGNQQEVLIYDISLEVGDTFKFHSSSGLVEARVMETSMDNGLKHVKFGSDISLCAYNTKVAFIESVGANIGIQGQLYSSYLLCNYKNGDYYYGNSLFNNECYLTWTGIVPKQFQDKIKIGYNTGSIQITNYIHPGIVSVYSLQGKKLLESNLPHGKHTIDIDQLKYGIYIVVIRMDDFTISEKVVHAK